MTQICNNRCRLLQSRPSHGASRISNPTWAMAVKTHLASNLYASREEANAVVKGLRRGRVTLADSP